MSFRRPSRERLRLELDAAIKCGDIQLVHTLITANHGDADDVAAAIGVTPDAEDRRRAVLAAYREWADEMADDDVADEVPSVLLALAQPSLWGTDW